MGADLNRPSDYESLYLARADEVHDCRPLIQGDILADIEIPGVGVEYEYAMIVGHPCTMRRGVSLAPRISMAPVTRYHQVQLAEWPTRHLRVMPLPTLKRPRDGESAPQHHAVRLDESGMVEASVVSAATRLACLSEEGILLLQQRLVFSLTRAVIQPVTLRNASIHVFEEVELQEEWTENTVPRSLSGAERVDAIAESAREFDEFLGADEPTLRDQLKLAAQRATVRRAVRTEVRRRTSGDTA